MDYSASATEAKNLIEGSLGEESISCRDFEKIIYLLGYSDCVYPTFYPLLEDLLNLVEKQTFDDRRELFHMILGIRIKFAVEQEEAECSQECRESFAKSLVRLRRMFFEVLDNLEAGDTAIRNILVGISACSREVKIANLIRDYEG